MVIALKTLYWYSYEYYIDPYQYKIIFVCIHNLEVTVCCFRCNPSVSKGCVVFSLSMSWRGEWTEHTKLIPGNRIQVSWSTGSHSSPLNVVVLTAWKIISWNRYLQKNAESSAHMCNLVVDSVAEFESSSIEKEITQKALAAIQSQDPLAIILGQFSFKCFFFSCADIFCRDYLTS